jgi:hypothetical protein
VWAFLRAESGATVPFTAAEDEESCAGADVETTSGRTEMITDP